MYKIELPQVSQVQLAVLYSMTGGLTRFRQPPDGCAYPFRADAGIIIESFQKIIY